MYNVYSRSFQIDSDHLKEFKDFFKKVDNTLTFKALPRKRYGVLTWYMIKVNSPETTEFEEKGKYKKLIDKTWRDYLVYKFEEGNK